MDRIPFSAYDFFGYLASGFLLIATVDFGFDLHWLFVNDPGIVLGLFWVSAAYVVGQILANPSAWLLERKIVGKILGKPNVNLFHDRPDKWRAKLFPGYFTPFPAATRSQILERAEKEASIEEAGEELFFHAFGQVKRDEWTMPRLNNFLNLYGFCRNISFSALVGAVVVVAGACWSNDPTKLVWLPIALLVSVGMLYRYLKFFRHYSVEVFISYSAISE